MRLLSIACALALTALAGCGARTGVQERDAGAPALVDAAVRPSIDAAVPPAIDARPPPPRDGGPIPAIDAGPPDLPDAAVEPLRATNLAAGGEHTCALTLDGGVRCWGDNGADQLGPTAVDESGVPVAVPIEGVTALSAGSRHTCALVTDGRVHCWGSDHSSQLGRGEESWVLGRGSYPVPAPVVDLDDVRAVSSGAGHSCALTLDDRVLCWGGNDHLEAGRPVGTVVTSPYWIRSLRDVLSIAADGSSSCVVHTSGGVTCWGDDRYGLLGTLGGRGATMPVAIPDVEDAVQVAGDDSTGCILHHDATVSCCPVTDGRVVRPEECASVVGLTRVTQIGVGGAVACALRSDGSVWCWGWNNYGVLGTDEVEFVGEPIAIPGARGVTEISVGGSHVCIRLRGGEVRCWGDNSNGQVGAGSVGGVYHEPVRVVGM